MNLLTILRARIESIADGNHSEGLKAVLQHIEVAARHLERGQSALDETAYTDAIYRTNQAFEGSLKEAYRVMTGNDPNRVRPYDIEDYFNQNKALRPRVLAQFKNYRQEWRNPSAHDYRLDFDENEALLAIVTVSAFAIMLVDQIAENVAYQGAKGLTDAATVEVVPKSTPLLYRVADLIAQFTANYHLGHTATELREVEVLGALRGFLAVTAPDLSTEHEAPIAPNIHERIDLLVTSSKEKVIVEIKRSRSKSRALEANAMQQVAHYMALSGIKQGIVYVFCSPNSGAVVRRTERIPLVSGEIVFLSAESRIGV